MTAIEVMAAGMTLEVEGQGKGEGSFWFSGFSDAVWALQPCGHQRTSPCLGTNSRFLPDYGGVHLDDAFGDQITHKYRLF